MGHPFLIMWAASVGNLGMVQLLIDSGTNTCATTEKGDTALHFARARPDPVTKRDVCRLLVEVGGANINARNENGETPLYRAVVRYDIKKVDVLLQIGADPKICNKAGESPLEAALRWESDKIVEMIILYLKTGPEAPLCAGAEGLSGQPC